MLEFLSRWDAGELIGLIAVVSGALIAITAILSGQWRRVRQTEIEASLKHDMLARGLSAEDIERILKAKSSRKKSRKEEC
jgi:hypothetical protein